MHKLLGQQKLKWGTEKNRCRKIVFANKFSFLVVRPKEHLQKERARIINEGNEIIIAYITN